VSDDAALIAALRRGDEGAFVELIERYHRSLLRLARIHVGAAAAEDVVQETWLGLLHGLNAFEGRASLKTWLFRVLINRARTRAGRESRTVPLSEVEPFVDPARFRPVDDPRWPGHWLIAPSPDDLPEQRLLAHELEGVVRQALTELPPAQREVVTLRDIDGWSNEEIADALEISEANQRVLLHRGRSRVRSAVEAYLVTERSRAPAR
jgi:RNA polymerase sigma-70 factor, ECF subfamily